MTSMATLAAVIQVQSLTVEKQAMVGTAAAMPNPNLVVVAAAVTRELVLVGTLAAGLNLNSQHLMCHQPRLQVQIPPST